jgi:D-arabinitol dehydrogenase (NADP+)
MVATPIGRRVVVDNTGSRGQCVECRRARPAYCRNLVAQGINAPGGFAEYMVTSSGRCFAVDDLETETAVLLNPSHASYTVSMSLDCGLGSPSCCSGRGPPD